MGRAVLLLSAAGGWSRVSPLFDPPPATSAHVGEGGGEGGWRVLLLLAISTSHVPPTKEGWGGEEMGWDGVVLGSSF